MLEYISAIGINVNLPDANPSASTVQTGLGFVFMLAAALAVVYIMISAIRFTTSAGDPQSVAQARKTLIYSLVGLGISVSALFITSFVRSNAAKAAGDANPFFGANGILTVLIAQLGYAIGIASVIMLIVGGLRFVSAAGQAQSVQAARNTVIYSLIGLGVAFIAQALVAFVLNNL